jgi:AraC-like DNA-binding protein
LAFVESFWLYKDERSPLAKERRLPDGATGLVINLHDDLIRLYDWNDPVRHTDYRGCVISGAHTTGVLLDTASLIFTMGVNFRPGGALPFLTLPALELRDQTVALENLWGVEVDDMRGQLLDAPTPAARFHILERFLLVRLSRSRVAHPAIAAALAAMRATPVPPTVAAIAEQIGLSQTRFTQVFREAIGLAPKQYLRVRRFQRALRLLDSGSARNWGDVVVGCGYFDQAHLVHDFQALAGLTPSTYLAMRGDFHNHVPLPA